MDQNYDERVTSIIKMVAELKSANLLISKELEKIILQLQDLQSKDSKQAIVEKKTNPTIKRVSEQDDIKTSDSGYNIQVVGLGTVKIN